jgi:hypothetical protein
VPWRLALHAIGCRPPVRHANNTPTENFVVVRSQRLEKKRAHPPQCRSGVEPRERNAMDDVRVGGGPTNPALRQSGSLRV